MERIAKSGGDRGLQAESIEGVRPAAEATRAAASQRERNSVESWDGESTSLLTRAGVEVHEVYSDGRVHIVSDTELSQADARALARKVEAFYDWDAQQQHWKDPAPLSAPLTVAALSRSVFSALVGDPTGSVGGFTTGPGLFVMPSDSARRGGPDDDVVVAHELGHVQDFREGGARIKDVPIYLQEGKAYLLGDQAALAKGGHPRNVDDVSRALARVTADDAKKVMTGFRTSRDEATWGRYGFYGETIGALYVEYLRLHFKGGKPDAFSRVADVIAGVGHGEDYAQAFSERFGASPAEAEAGFVKWMRDTDGKPDLRLEDTLYDPASLSRAA